MSVARAGGAAAAPDPKEVLRRALVEIRGLKERLAAAERGPAGATAASAPVAVLGIGCRFPGGAADPEGFWRLLMDGRDAVGPRPPGRWARDGAETLPEGGFLADVESFDAGFFGIAPREAAAMDPQHRLLLEVAWEALERAALGPERLAGSPTGVFVGLATNDWFRRVPDEALDRHFGSGSSPAVAAGRIAYLLDLRGPCLTLDTACSSSLVAVHQAMRALRAGDCDLALAGGVSLMLGPELGRSFRAAGMLAPDGRCKAFDARADGYGRGEGCGVVVLRRLEDALRDGDPVLAVLRGSAINQDGRSAGLTAPNGPAQTALVRRALADAGLAPADLDYIEAHGTGTALGDPIEWHALAAAFAGRDRPLPVGSVKTNIGHAEAAAGIAGLVKAALAVGHGMAPPSLHFSRLNPAIVPSPALEVAAAPRPGVRCAGVSAFGFSGTNAHVVVEAPPAAERAAAAAAGPGVLLLSARDPEALRGLAARFRAAFDSGLGFDAACRTAPAAGRARHPWWIAVRAPEELDSAVPSNAPPPALPAADARPRVALPATPFRRERFPLPGRRPTTARLLPPDDPLLAGTGGLAHLGVLLALVNEAEGGPPGALNDVSFPTALHLAAPREVRARREGARLLLESRVPGEPGWVPHLLADEAAPTALPEPPECPAPETAAAPLYDRIAAAGFHFGPEARWIERLAVADGSARASLVRRDGAGPRPGVVEAAAQLAYALLPGDAPPAMLARVARLRWRASWFEAASGWMQRRERRADGLLVADFGVLDAAGRPVLHADEAVFAPLPDRGAAWSRRVLWRPVPAVPAAVSAETPELWFPPESSDAAALCAALLDRVNRAEPGRPFRIVTRGAQATGREAGAPDPAQAALWGLAQAVIAERAELRCRLVDLDPDLPLAAQRGLAEAEAWADDEPAVALRGGRRLARRFEPLAAGPEARPQAATLARPGIVAWRAVPEPDAAPARGTVRVGVVAAGLSFRDRLLLNGMAPAGSPLGADCAGVVEAAGEGVAEPRPGDPVVAFAANAIADAVTVPAVAVAPAPCSDLAAAASMPVPYATAMASLPPLGPGDRVLIHQAGSATGLAALEIARRAGAEVVATASLPRHPWFAPLGLRALLDSRAPANWGGALEGVTVAFGAFEPALAARLAPVPVVNLDKRAPGHFDLDRLSSAERAALLGRLDGLPPLPVHLVGREDLAEALGAAPLPAPGRAVVLLRRPPPVRIAPGSLHLVTGAAGALGRLVSGWLAGQGACLCLVDRMPVAARRGDVPFQADAGDAEAMAGLFERLAREGTPVRGVFHCAALVDDDPLASQTPERIAAVLHAKLAGARALDALTRAEAVRGALEHFVLFSSVVGSLPSARQGGYAAANAALDQIAAARRRLGLPGLSLAWGPWAAGIGARMGARAAEAWRGFGVSPILPAAGLRALPGLLASPEAHLLVADTGGTAPGAAGSAPAAAPPAAVATGPVTVARLQGVLAPLLGEREPARLDPAAPLLSLGLDSLAAVEFSRALSRELGRPVAPDFVFRHPTLAAAAAALQPPPPGAAAEPTRSAVLHAPAWEAAPAPRSGTQRPARIHGAGRLAEGLRAALGDADDAADLVDLTALDLSDAAEPAAARDAWFSALVPLLQARMGATDARLLLVLPAASPLTPAAEAFATALQAEQPLWRVGTLRIHPALVDPMVALLREVAVAGEEPRVSLSPGGRSVQRLRALPTPAAPWRMDPDGTWLVTGGSGGVGARLAARLAAGGVRHIVLASRRPALPAALAGARAQVTLRAADLSAEAEVAALVADAARAALPLRGIVHAAGAVADGRVADTPWEELRGAFPAKADAARRLDKLSRPLPGLSHFVLCSSSSAWFGLPGTAGYAAANGALDAVVAERRSEGLPAQSIAWCGWEGVGMAADPALWAGGRAPALPPSVLDGAFEAALAGGEPHVVVLPDGWREPAPGRMQQAVPSCEREGA